MPAFQTQKGGIFCAKVVTICPPKIPQRSWRDNPYQLRQRASNSANHWRTESMLIQSVNGFPVVPLVCSIIWERSLIPSATKAFGKSLKTSFESTGQFANESREAWSPFL